VISETAYDEHVEQLFQVLERVAGALRNAGIEYRVVGGVAIFLHVSEQDPIAARMTRDIDMVVARADLDRIAFAVEPLGLQYKHVAGVDMLVDTASGKARSAVHLLFVGEKVRPDYLDSVPCFSSAVIAKAGTLLAPVADLVRMKLTSFRLKDKVHIQDLDGVGLITPEIEAGLPGELRQRLVAVRAER
jgi:hypothetical protein